MRILVVVPRFVRSFGEFYQFPLGLAYIAAAAKKSGHMVYGLNLNHVFGSEAGLVTAKVRELSIDACLTGGLLPFLQGIRKIFVGARNGNKDILNVAGGGVVSSDPLISLDLMDIDIGIIGEGEVTVVETLNACERDSDLAEIQGIVYRNRKGEVVQTAYRKPIKDLSKIVYPEYDLLGFGEHLDLLRPLDHHFFQTQYDNNPRTIDMITSRSCPFKCTFCFHPVGKVYRERPLDDFFNELKQYINKYRINMVSILDELFSLKKNRLLEFCERIRPLNVQWMVQLHVNTVDENVLNNMKDAGCSYISYGIESMNETVLRSMQKKSKKNRIMMALERTYDRRIGIQGNLIFGDTAETLETANETMSWWAHNRKYQVYLSRLQIFPGSPDYIMAIQDGLITDRLEFSEKLPIDLNISNMNNSNLEVMVFQLKIHGTTLLNLASIRHFKKSEVQIDGRDITYDIVWDCPRCKHTNNYKQCVLRPDHRYFIRVFCRECYSRWDIENKAFGMPSQSVALESSQQNQMVSNSAPTDGGVILETEDIYSSNDGDILRQWTKRNRAVQYIYEKECDPQMEIRRAGRDLQEDLFNPERHLRFANALREVRAFGAARLHYQQAIDICHTGFVQANSTEVFPSFKYRKFLNKLMSDPEYLKYSETYFVSYSDDPPPHRPSRADQQVIVASMS